MISIDKDNVSEIDNLKKELESKNQTIDQLKSMLIKFEHQNIKLENLLKQTFRYQNDTNINNNGINALRQGVQQIITDNKNGLIDELFKNLKPINLKKRRM